AVGEEDRVMVAREGAGDVDDIGPEQRLAALDGDDHRAGLGELGGDDLEVQGGHLVLAPRRVLPEGAESAGEVAAVRELDDRVDGVVAQKSLDEPRPTEGVAEDGQRPHRVPPRRLPKRWETIRLAAPANEESTPVECFSSAPWSAVAKRSTASRSMISGG